MKVSKWVDMGQDVEVEIGVDDIRGALGEAFARVTDRPEWLGEAPNVNDVTMALNSIGAFLKALTDTQIALLNAAQRKTIHGFLVEQAKRYEPVEEPAKGGTE